MKIISLNTWGGSAGSEELIAFFKKHEDVDVFCLQEVWNGGEHMVGQIAGGAELKGVNTNLFEDIRAALPNHNAFFRPHYHDFFGLALFVRKNISVETEGEASIYREKGFASDEDRGNMHRILQYVSLPEVNVVNLHGLWNGKGKTDTEERLIQSDRIISFLKTQKSPFIVVGDFNLRPDTESVQKIEDSGLRNLITEFGITSTRTRHYTKTSEQFADYAFVSKDVEVLDFKVLPDEVSDHAALYLEFA